MLNEEILKVKEQTELEQKVNNLSTNYLQTKKNVHSLVKWYREVNPTIQKKVMQKPSFLESYIHYFLHLLIIALTIFAVYVVKSKINNLDNNYNAQIETLNTKIKNLEQEINKIKAPAVQPAHKKNKK